MESLCKVALDARLKRLIRDAVKGRRRGQGAFLGPLRRAKGRGQKKTAAGEAFLRTQIREGGFSREVLPPAKPGKAKGTAHFWDDVCRKTAAESPSLAILTKIGGKSLEDHVGSFTDQTRIEGGYSQVDHASSKLADDTLRDKIASTMLRLDEEVRGHRKRAHAERLLFKQAQLGMTQLPQTFSEFEEKLAQLVREDLTVLERALELTGGNVKLGELCERESQALDASEKFQASILGDDA